MMSSDDVVFRIWDFPRLQSNDVRRTKAARRESAKLLVKSSPIRAAARGCSSVGTRHCYINKRGSSRHRGFIGFQFAPNRTPPFLCPYHLNSPPLTPGELSFSQRLATTPLRYGSPSTGTKYWTKWTFLFSHYLTRRLAKHAFSYYCHSLDKISRSPIIERKSN